MHWLYNEPYFAETFREIGDKFRQVEKYEYSCIRQEEVPLLNTIQKLQAQVNIST